MAPDFSLPDQADTIHTLSQYKGKWVVVYFYPKDDTPGCTVEACSFRDAFSEFTRNNVVVLGVSKDSTASHQKFAEKHQLPFILLSDPTKETIKAYGAWGKKKFMGREYDGILRNTYLIDPNGKIFKTYEKVTPKDHAQQILADIKTQ